VTEPGPRSTDAEYGIDLDAIVGLLRQCGQKAAAPLEVEQIGAGQSNVTLRLTDHALNRWVLRRPPLGEMLESAHDMAREYRVLAALQHTPVPTPAVFGLGEGRGGATMLLMEWVDGLVIDGRTSAERLPPAIRREVGYSMVEALTRLHAVDPDEVGLGDLASRRPYAERQLKRWLRQWEASRTQECPGVEELARRLQAAIPDQHEVRIVHGDFGLSNVLLDGDRGRVRAVLDWELCTLGEPLADLGTLLAYWTQQADERLFPNDATAAGGFVPGDELVAAYCEATGRDPASVAFWHALALWKLAIIGEGVRRRALDDSRNAQRTGIPGPELAEKLVARATGVADAAF
jgi:aminoglycoside phosphotransferase (APT) family kinase protein